MCVFDSCHATMCSLLIVGCKAAQEVVLRLCWPLHSRRRPAFGFRPDSSFSLAFTVNEACQVGPVLWTSVELHPSSRLFLCVFIHFVAIFHLSLTETRGMVQENIWKHQPFLGWSLVVSITTSRLMCPCPKANVSLVWSFPSGPG